MRPALEDEWGLEPWDDNPDGVDAHDIRESSEPEIDDEGREICLLVQKYVHRTGVCIGLRPPQAAGASDRTGASTGPGLANPLRPGQR